MVTLQSNGDPAVDPSAIAWGDDDRGVLLLHGLTGTPWDVRPFAETLRDRGFAIRSPLLPGHDAVTTLERVTWRDWALAADSALDALLDGGRRRVLVVGFSMGSLLALRMAALRPRELRGVVAMSVPLALPAWQRHAIAVLAGLRDRPWLGRLVGMLPKDGPDVRIERAHRESPSLPAFPYPALAQLVALQAEVTGLLPLVRVPLLLLHGVYDHVAPVEHSARVAQRVSSSSVRRVLLPNSFHIVGLDLDRERACAEVVDFAISVLGAPHPTPSPEEDPR